MSSGVTLRLLEEVVDMVAFGICVCVVRACLYMPTLFFFYCCCCCPATVFFPFFFIILWHVAIDVSSPFVVASIYIVIDIVAVVVVRAVGWGVILAILVA